MERALIEVVEEKGLRVKSVDQPGLKNGKAFAGELTRPFNAATVAVLAIDDAAPKKALCLVII